MAEKEVHGFQTEVRQMLNLMINSLYSKKEIFLRELISNASDAIDRLRFEALDKPELLADSAKPMIRVSFDTDARTVTVSDDGIGMSREEVMDHLGTIAKSGTREFFSSLTGDRQKDSQLIGQFGVGFYSAFIVGDRVTVVTRRAGTDAATRWESDGQGEYTVEDGERSQPGTDVIVHMREGEDTFLDSMELRDVIRKYSDHICVPIMMNKDDWKDGKKVVSPELERVNNAAALWTRPKSEITEDQYKEFYRHVSHDYGDPLAWTHNRVEGTTEYTQLLFVPKKAPFDLWNPQARHGLKLYVRRVFIMDDAEKLMPRYLRFVRGVVDSADLPLNVSREILQDSRDMKLIREGCTKRVLSLLEDLAKNKPEDYAEFWKEFGRVLKEGVGEDFGNQKRIAGLLRFVSTASEGACSVSLADYVARMKEGQKAIYYVTGESTAAAAACPQLEIFHKKGIDVLLMGDPVDDWMMTFLHEYEGKDFVNITQGSLDLGDLEDKEEAERQKKAEEAFSGLVGRFKASLGDKVKEVRVSTRLTESPACIVSEEGELNRNLARMLRSAGQDVPESKPILEINPDNPLVSRLQEAGDEELGAWTELLLDQAKLADGETLEDPAAFVRRMNALLAKAVK